ncbi:MAG: LPS-assembly protein LptD [Desulfuromusa sp.]|nr:LPS-assembly protein LptD [Desulfuromusa sp.]
MLRFCLLLALLTGPYLATAADWKGTGDSQLPIQLEADQLSYQKEIGLYQASGDVKMVQGDLEVSSQSLKWNEISGEFDAEGDVELISPDQELFGSRVRFNTQDGTGIINNGRFYLRDPNLYVRGETIERLGKLDYRITRGTFTTCNGEIPAWKFGASRLDVTIDGYARARNTVFYINDIPSFYLPYMIYPATNKRKSGLLMPKVGYSDRRGYQYSGAYYQVLGVNQDATLYFDYLSEMGLGKGLEYRYVFGQGNAGEAHAYLLDVDKIDGETIDEKRYALEWEHDGFLPGGIRMVADGMYVNDDEYFKDFGDMAGEYNRTEVKSIFSLSKNWEKYSLIGRMEYIKDLESDDNTTLQKLPSINFDASRQRIMDSDFYYALNSEYTNFWSQDGLKGNRAIVRPTLSASFQLWDVVNLAPEVTYRQRYYWGINNGYDSEQQGVAAFTTRATTQMQKVFHQPSDSVARLRHSIEPELVYTYIPEIDQSELPHFDQFDRIDNANLFSYALTQRLTARVDHANGGPSYRELVYFRLSQAYDLTNEFRGRQRFQDLRLQSALLPTEWLSLLSDTSLDVSSGDWTEVTVAGKVSNQQGNSVKVLYSYELESDIDYIEATLSAAFLKPFYFDYQQRYDLVTDKQLEQVIGVEYRHQCWGAKLTYRDQDRDDNRDRSVMLTFTMRGIGSVGGVGSSSLGGF